MERDWMTSNGRIIKLATSAYLIAFAVYLMLFTTGACLSAPSINMGRASEEGELSDAVYQKKAKALRVAILKRLGAVCLGDGHNCTMSMPDPTVVKKAQKLIDQAKVLIEQQDYFGALGLLLEEEDLNWAAARNADWKTWHEPSLRQKCFEGIEKTQTKEEFVKTMRHQWDLWREDDVGDMLDRALANCSIDPRSPQARLQIGDQLLASGDLRGAAMEYFAASLLKDKIGEEMRGLCYDIEDERDQSKIRTLYYWWGISIFTPSTRPYIEQLIRLDKSKFKENYGAYWRDLTWLGDSCFCNREYAKALTTYEHLKEVKEAIQAEDIWARCGACCLILGKNDRAVDDFKRSIDWVNAHNHDLQPWIFGISNYHPCYSYVVLLCQLIKQERREEALAVIQKAKALIGPQLNKY
jgi:tetratricopeptide (TPR) repeat protein